MRTMATSILCSDQPVGNAQAATLFHESRYLTSWVTPESLEVQEKYKELTESVGDRTERITIIWDYVKSIPYTQAVHSKVSIDGRTFVQKDAWLDPGQAMQVNKLNCFNKATLVTSLLRQEFSPREAYICLCNVNMDGIGGHAVGYLKLDRDYVVETTSPTLRSPFLLAEALDAYEAVIFFNDQEVSYIPDARLREPMGFCCVNWLESYLNEKLCSSYI